MIIPAHNEETRLPDSLSKVMTFLHSQTYDAEVLVIDNGSVDNTAEIVKGFTKQYPNLRLLQEERAGKGLAVRRGMLEADGEYRFICDADLSMPIDEVVNFLPPILQDYDIAIASREITGAVRYNEPRYRHWIGRIFNLLVQILAVPGFSDTQCGFKCFKAPAAQDLFKVQVLDGWTFDVEVLFIAQRRGYRIVEVPIHWYHSPASRIRILNDSIQMFLDLFRIRRNWRHGLYESKAR
ncbi:MAG: glycosyltransferase [Anaerolineales bacterium]|nr:glycosyltransferase [Anaerolineales bacterium]